MYLVPSSSRTQCDRSHLQMCVFVGFAFVCLTCHQLVCTHEATHLYPRVPAVHLPFAACHLPPSAVARCSRKTSAVHVVQLPIPIVTRQVWCEHMPILGIKAGACLDHLATHDMTNAFSQSLPRLPHRPTLWLWDKHCLLCRAPSYLKSKQMNTDRSPTAPPSQRINRLISLCRAYTASISVKSSEQHSS